MSELDEFNKNERYFSRGNFEMLFWVSLIIFFFSLFFANDVSIYYLIGVIVFFILSRLNWKSKKINLWNKKIRKITNGKNSDK